MPGQMSAGATEEQVRVIRVGRASAGSGGFIQRAMGVTSTSCSPNFSVAAAWLGGLFSAIRKEVQP